MYLRLIPCAFPFCSGVLLNWWDRVERHFSPFSIHNAAEAVVTPHPDKYHNYHLCLSQLSRLSIDCHIHHTCTRRGAWCVSFYREVKVRFSAAVSLQNPTVGRSVVKCPLVDQIELGHSPFISANDLSAEGRRRLERSTDEQEKGSDGENPRLEAFSNLNNRCVQTGRRKNEGTSA